MSLVSLLAKGYAGITFFDHRRLRRALADPARAERVLVEDLTRDLMQTTRGRALGLDGDPARFFDRVPIVTYRDLAPLVEEQMATGAPVVSPGEVALYERTSGSSGQKKFIPYSKLLLRTFARMFRAWSHDVVARGPRLESARFYFSISPSFDDDAPRASGARIGVDDDAGYLDGLSRRLLAPFFVAPRALARERDPQRFLDETVRALLRTPRLEVVSVWSPTFFLALLDHLRAHGARLVDTLPRGTRADDVARALRDHTDDERALVSRLWPDVRFVSCWRAGHARAPAERLAALFPRALVQGKGLLATEGPVSIPLVDEPGDACAPLVDDVLIEVLGDSGDARLLSALDEGDEGEVVISPRGGFARYRLGDRVRVTRAIDGTPRLTFLGRADRVSDLVGEKLEEAFVARVLDDVAPAATTRTLVAVLSPRARYALFVDAALDDDARTGLVRTLDAALGQAFHYRHARTLGQLDAPLIVARPDAGARLLDAWTRSGRRAGDMKPCALVVVPLPVDDA